MAKKDEIKMNKFFQYKLWIKIKEDVNNFFLYFLFDWLSDVLGVGNIRFLANRTGNATFNRPQDSLYKCIFFLSLSPFPNHRQVLQLWEPEQRTASPFP